MHSFRIPNVSVVVTEPWILIGRCRHSDIIVHEDVYSVLLIVDIRLRFCSFV